MAYFKCGIKQWGHSVLKVMILSELGLCLTIHSIMWRGSVVSRL